MALVENHNFLPHNNNTLEVSILNNIKGNELLNFYLNVYFELAKKVLNLYFEIILFFRIIYLTPPK